MEMTASKGRRLLVCNPSGRVSRILAATGLTMSASSIPAAMRRWRWSPQGARHRLCRRAAAVTRFAGDQEPRARECLRYGPEGSDREIEALFRHKPAEDEYARVMPWSRRRFDVRRFHAVVRHRRSGGELWHPSAQISMDRP